MGRKADDSPVTAADLRAERTLREEIAKAYPGESILGEEEGLSGEGKERWVIDPIDGTKSFVSGVPLFGTLLAFEVAGEVQLGVMYFPALKEIAYAQLGQGAFWNGERCRVSGVSDLANAVVSTGSIVSLKRWGLLEGVASVGEHLLALRGWSDAYGHLLVATGRIEAMVDPVLSYWDIAAPKLIVEEAGGTFTAFDGSPNPVDQGLSSNAILHRELLVGLGPRNSV